jgi:hypothetical protein
MLSVRGANVQSSCHAVSAKTAMSAISTMP